MIDTDRLFEGLSTDQSTAVEFDDQPTEDAIRSEVKRLKAEGLCGRRIAEQRLGPYFLASHNHGQRELDLLEEIVEAEFERSDLCVRTRSSECSRLSGGCKGSQ